MMRPLDDRFLRPDDWPESIQADETGAGSWIAPDDDLPMFFAGLVIGIPAGSIIGACIALAVAL